MKKWEAYVKKEQYNELFLSRLIRIVSLIKSRKPNKISAKRKPLLKKKIDVIIYEALKGKHKKEIKEKRPRLFRLKEKHSKAQIQSILDKFGRHPKMRKLIGSVPF